MLALRTISVLASTMASFASRSIAEDTPLGRLTRSRKTGRTWPGAPGERMQDVDRTSRIQPLPEASGARRAQDLQVKRTDGCAGPQPLAGKQAARVPLRNSDLMSAMGLGGVP